MGKEHVLANSTLCHVEALKVHYKPQILLVSQRHCRSTAFHVALPCFTQNGADLNVEN